MIRSLVTRLRGLCTPRVFRWFVVGVLFEMPDLLLIAFLVGTLGWPYALGTAISGELCTIMRFLVTDRFVFGHRRPTVLRLWQYHLANLLGFAVWWTGANVLEHLGVHYIVASVFATVISAAVNLVSNFLWVWRKPKETGPASTTAVSRLAAPTESAK